MVSSRALVELVLLGPTNDRRQLQDSPVLGDVWIAFATKPLAPRDLLISPYRPRPAGPVAVLLAKRLEKYGRPRDSGNEADAAHVAYLQGLVAARLYFSELLEVVVPMTGWWQERQVRTEIAKFTRPRLSRIVEVILQWARAASADEQAERASRFGDFTALDRYVALAAIVLWAGTRKADDPDGTQGAGGLLGTLDSAKPVVDEINALFQRILKAPAARLPHDHPRDRKIPLVWQISLNRRAQPALDKSVAAVKGDAARTVFKVDCSEITWAVLDSGIDASHPAFLAADGTNRVTRRFDFSNIRRIVSLDNCNVASPAFKQRLDTLIEGRGLDRTKAMATLRTLAEDADNDRAINWALVEPFVEVRPPAVMKPASGHGTHVAGIIGARQPTAANGGKARRTQIVDGMCPDIRLYDFKVLGASSTLEDTEFAIIAALQYIRYLNESRTFTTVHGANLSLAIPHDVRNFACGRTPVCDECERLVGSGVVVVVAAGNLGYHSFETGEGAFEGYAAFSITDPGNADEVITVGATHRSWPHTYGVSFFSSRGPTGDGRMKPDLVAPGERIRSAVPDGGWKELDGTSMAAPHVSGAAAMLMARYTELIGQPRRIKRILCESATDLGRERSFQGHGMLDVLRAFQKV